MKEGSSFNKNIEVEMTVVQIGNGKQNIFFGEPLNDLLYKGKTKVFPLGEEIEIRCEKRLEDQDKKFHQGPG